MLVYKTDKDDVKCINYFGEINDGKVVINFQNRTTSTKVEDIKKILFLKRRKLHYNFIFLFISVYFLVLFYYTNMIFIYKLIVLGLGLIAFTVSLIFKSYEHKFVLIKKHDFMEFIIQNELISDVENLVLEFNNYPRKNVSIQTNLKYS